MEAWVVVDKSRQQSGFLKRREVILHQPGQMSLDIILDRYGKGLAALATADFDRAKATSAAGFYRNELRIMALLLLAQGILHNKPD